jgi:hypothetical protein
MDFQNIISRISEINLRNLMNFRMSFIDSKSEQNFYVKCRER